MEMKIQPAAKIEGRTKVPGDRDIGLGALLFSSLSEGTVEIEGIPETEERRSTVDCLQQLGGEFAENGTKLTVKGKGLRGFQEPEDVLNAGNSHTAAHLLAGLLSGQPFHSTLTGGTSLKSCSLKTVTEPLMQMGASISGRHRGEQLPLAIRGYDLLPINYSLPPASSRLKSALLTASLFSRGITTLVDNYQTNDHTERALRHLGVQIDKTGKHYTNIMAPLHLQGDNFYVPGDISSAAFLIVAATLAQRGEVYLEDVGINPCRTTVLEVLDQMGADIRMENRREYNFEPLADLVIRGGRKLMGTEIGEMALCRLSDDLPPVVVAALFAQGDTVIKGTNVLPQDKKAQLKHLCSELGKMGAKINQQEKSLIISGSAGLTGASCESHGDDAVAMALATAALFARGETIISGAEAALASFPGFFDVMHDLVS